MSAQTAIVPFAIFPGMEQPFGFPGSAKDDIKKYFCWHLSAREQTERHTDPVTRFVNVWKLGAPPQFVSEKVDMSCLILQFFCINKSWFNHVYLFA